MQSLTQNRSQREAGRSETGRFIPKHRFDRINLALKEQKEKSVRLEAEINKLQHQITDLEALRPQNEALTRENVIISEIAKSKAKNVFAVKSQIDLNNTPPEKLAATLQRKLAKLKRLEPYLFYGGECYILTPLKNKFNLEK